MKGQPEHKNFFTHRNRLLNNFHKYNHLSTVFHKTRLIALHEFSSLNSNIQKLFNY